MNVIDFKIKMFTWSLYFDLNLGIHSKKIPISDSYKFSINSINLNSEAGVVVLGGFREGVLNQVIKETDLLYKAKYNFNW